MSLTLFAAIAATSAALGWAAGRVARRRALPPAIARDELPWRLPVAVGDVLVRTAEDEALLEGALALRDGEDIVAVVFFSPRRDAADRVVVAFPRPSSELLWLVVTDAGRTTDPPTTLDADGAALPRTMRAAVTVERVGEHAPELGPSLVVGLYRDAGDRAAIVLRGTRTLVAVGERLPVGVLDRLPGR